MAGQIEPTDIKLDYVSIAETRKMSGLRLILGAYPIPGPWREACKGLFHVKGIPYTPVATGDEGASDLLIGVDNSQSELIAWTGQSSAPVATWNDELPRSKWIDQIFLAERIEPDSRLVPEDIDLRMRMFGLINELASENGLVWLKRLGMAHGPLQSLPEGDEGRAFWEFLGEKYGYTRERAEALDEKWIQFKLFGIMPLTLIFSLAQLPLINRHAIEANRRTPYAKRLKKPYTGPSPVR